jgi:hypothetical protein
MTFSPEGHQNLDRACELGQCRSDRIGSDQSGDSTQFDGESSYRGGIRRHSAQWSTCSELHPNNGPLHPEVAGGRNMLWRANSLASNRLRSASGVGSKGNSGAWGSCGIT